MNCQKILVDLFETRSEPQRLRAGALLWTIILEGSEVANGTSRLDRSRLLALLCWAYASVFGKGEFARVIGKANLLVILP
jgi:hypothetical protein